MQRNDPVPCRPEEKSGNRKNFAPKILICVLIFQTIKNSHRIKKSDRLRNFSPVILHISKNTNIDKAKKKYTMADLRTTFMGYN